MLRHIRDLFNDVLRQADLLLLALCCGASLFGILMVTSATRYMHTNRYMLVQTASLLIGVVLYLVVSQIDVGELVKYWKWIFLVGVAFILLLLIVKLTFILVLAKQLSWLKENRDLKSIPSVAMLAVHFGVIFVLYYKVSADMGSALVFLFIFACMCFVAGVALRWFLIGGGAAALLFYAMWDGGKIFGQGLFKGVQTQSEAASSLPHRHTDFIFSVIGEELGLVGCLLTLALLTAIVLRCIYVARHAKTQLESYVCIGVASIIIFQVIVNVGMCLFVMPVIGLTLPFISYGGSSLVMLFAAMGLVSGAHGRAKPDWLR